jgi:RNA polymerase sigma-70 factor (ECF subfamily)
MMSAPTTAAGPPESDLDEAYRHMRSRLRAFIASRVGNPETAEDLTQEVLLRLVRSGSAVDDPTAWLYRVARNVIIDHYRGRRPQPADPTMPGADGVVDPFADDPDGARFELSRCLRSLVDRLPQPYRSAVRSIDLDGTTQTAASAAAGVSVSGMKSRVQRGRRHLRDLLMHCCTIEVSAIGAVMDYAGPSACTADSACAR